MTADELARLEHANFIGALAVIGAGAADAFIDRRDGVAIVATGLAFRLFNQVIVEDDAADPAAVAAAVERLRARGAPFLLDLRVGIDDRFIPTATACGLVPISATPWLPGMAWYPLEAVAAEPPAIDAGHQIRRATDVVGLEDHLQVVIRGFGVPEVVARQIVTAQALEQPDVVVYVGYTDGEPVSSGMGYRLGRTIGVYNIATIEPARGRGYGAAMTRRVVADGVAAGCDVAILQASEMGRPIYERIGFRTVVEYMAHVEAPPDERAPVVSPAG